MNMKRIVTVLLTLLALITAGFAQSPNFDKRHVFGDIDYLGEASTSGNSVVITGTNDAPAQLVFKHNNRVTIRVMSRRFVLKENSISSNQAKARVYLYDSIHHSIDSIYHNDLGFRYIDDKNLVMLYRKDNGVGSGPFHDTYHEYDIFLEAIYWYRDNDYMDFRRLEGTSGDSEGLVASVNYFRKADYLKIQALDMKHPMENMNQFLKLSAMNTTGSTSTITLRTSNTRKRRCSR